MSLGPRHGDVAQSSFLVQFDRIVPLGHGAMGGERALLVPHEKDRVEFHTLGGVNGHEIGDDTSFRFRFGLLVGLRVRQERRVVEELSQGTVRRRGGGGPRTLARLRRQARPLPVVIRRRRQQFHDVPPAIGELLARLTYGIEVGLEIELVDYGIQQSGDAPLRRVRSDPSHLDRQGKEPIHRAFRYVIIGGGYSAERRIASSVSIGER
mmetsp:Transcript_10519/g.30982  ORF Transcript_10519/g.30982 Transcript_10519/m.30982 type:complete len:209 (-) Transcript_10519:662-1288(-)